VPCPSIIRKDGYRAKGTRHAIRPAAAGSHALPRQIRARGSAEAMRAQPARLPALVGRLFRSAAVTAAIVLAVAACSSPGTFMNQPLRSLQPSSQNLSISTGGYRRSQLAKVDTTSDVLVALAFSGGGKRSAAFSYGALRGLRDLHIDYHGQRSLLQMVDVISSVSGGSFTAAYYGLFHDRIFTNYESDFLKRDIEAYIYGTYLLPWEWRWMFDPRYGTNDRMAEIYDETMFHGATYADLIANGLPQINIDATDINYGTVFPFNQDQFDLICSDLTSFPLARAVAASNGFPVIFAPINLTDYASDCAPRVPRWVLQAESAPHLSREHYLAHIARLYLDPNKTSYVHLMDGGISDNLAMRGMLNAVLSYSANFAAYQPDVLHIRRVLAISVDGQAAANSSWPKQRSISGLGQIFEAVSGAQIDAYNFETLLLAKSLVATFVDNIRTARCQRSALIDGAPCNDVRGYFVHLSLDDVADPAVRERLQSIATGLTIPSDDVDLLVKAGESVVRDAPELKEFRRDVESAPAS
jgi:NTE family protein